MAITGLWLRNGSEPGDLEVLAEIAGQWRIVIRARSEPSMSHFVEPLGIRRIALGVAEAEPGI